MPFDGLRRHDSPPLRPNRLAAGDAVSLPPTRRQVRAMRWVWWLFWGAFAAGMLTRFVWEALR